MEPQEARKIVVNDIREVYAHAWTQFAFIKEDQARVRAINGVMITIDKVWPFLAPKDPPVPAQTAPAPTKAPVAAPAAQPATKPAQAPPPARKPAEAPAPPPTKPAKEQPPKAAPPVQQQFNPPPTPAYDREALRWNRCPKCDNTDIYGEYEKQGKDGKMHTKQYQACFGNNEGLPQHPGIFLNADGKTVPMKPQETSS